MKVRVQLFAGAREIAGAESLEVELAEGATYSDLAEAVIASKPQLAALAGAGRFAAETSYVRGEEPIDPQSEIALIPPVSGG